MVRQLFCVPHAGLVWKWMKCVCVAVAVKSTGCVPEAIAPDATASDMVMWSVVMLLVNRIGILSVEAYLEKWRIAILGIFVISMLLTPADPVSMLLMAVPLTALYFLGVGLCKWMPRGRNPFDEAYEP